ncbi:hypothetical protein [Corallococcus exercitus]|uniref:hypothetical protein n=1 Tax=Corallococcus exercitus TaxID=2316736 RepID=UPI0035D4E070
MSMLKRPLSAFMLGACLFALGACDSKDDPAPDAGPGVDAGSDAGTDPDAGSDAGSAVVPEGYTLLTPSETEVHSVPRGGMDDPLRFAFIAQAGHHYDFIVEAGVGDHVLGMRDGAGKTLAYGANQSTRFAPYAWHWSGLTEGAVYTVEAWQYDETSPEPFVFRFVDKGLDDHGDLFATATPYTPSEQPLVGAGEHWGERDLLSFQTVAGNVYALDCTFPTPYWDLSILNPVGQRYGVTDNSTFEETQAATAFKSPGGLFYAAIQDQQDKATPQPYTCVLRDRGAEDHGDTVQVATALAAGTASVQGKIEVLGDRDFFSLGVVAGHSYRASCTIDGNKRCEVWNTAPGSASPGPSGSDRTVTVFKASQATHFVSVNGDLSVPARWVEGHYTLQLEDLGTNAP